MQVDGRHRLWSVSLILGANRLVACAPTGSAPAMPGSKPRVSKLQDSRLRPPAIIAAYKTLCLCFYSCLGSSEPRCPQLPVPGSMSVLVRVSVPISAALSLFGTASPVFGHHEAVSPSDLGL